MTIETAIDLVCKTLELDRPTLCCSDGCKQNSKYSDGRIIVTYILRTPNRHATFERIAYYLGRGVRNEKGNHSQTIRFFRLANELIEVNDRRFTEKLAKVKKSFVDENKDKLSHNKP